jgi:hypothetical protein
MKGTDKLDKAGSSERPPVGFADTTRARLITRFTALLDLLEKAPEQARNELGLMTVDALSNQSTKLAGTALGEAMDSIRKGGDATLPLLRARRALDGPPRTTNKVLSWSHGW